MVLREELERRELELLSPYAAKAAESSGRLTEEEPDDFRTIYQRDRDRIIHCKAFRRLMHKTQVFMAPEGDHFSTRLTHTLEVSQIARTISRALNLNEDLTEAIAMGHDLGHTPFGHAGERFLNEIHPGGFSHNLQSLRVVDELEKRRNGKPMNLSMEVRDGIVNHSGPNKPYTLEGAVVRISDRIAYINHDIDDAIRAGIITQSVLPKDCLEVLGETHGERINNLVMDIVRCSDGQREIVQSAVMGQYMNKLRDFMFEAVYFNPLVKENEEQNKIGSLIKGLYDYYLSHPEELPADEKLQLDMDSTAEVVKDYIAGMTDRYAINVYENLFIPKAWSIN